MLKDDVCDEICKPEVITKTEVITKLDTEKCYLEDLSDKLSDFSLSDLQRGGHPDPAVMGTGQARNKVENSRGFLEC